jgi:hypothetical protein
LIEYKRSEIGYPWSLCAHVLGYLMLTIACLDLAQSGQSSCARVCPLLGNSGHPKISQKVTYPHVS